MSKYYDYIVKSDAVEYYVISVSLENNCLNLSFKCGQFGITIII